MEQSIAGAMLCFEAKYHQLLSLCNTLNLFLALCSISLLSILSELLQAQLLNFLVNSFRKYFH